jgi:hypothetical protein
VAKRPKAKLGDVFLVPIDDKRVGVGQVVDVLDKELYLVVFEGCWPREDPPTADCVDGLEVAFASLSLDAKIWHGHWPIVGNRKANLGNIALPVFKVERGGEFYVESHDERRTRKATAEEAVQLRFRKTVAPVRLEKALKAVHDVVEWSSEYDEIRYERLKESSKVQV